MSDLRVADRDPHPSDAGEVRERGLLALSELKWAEARRRVAVIEALAARRSVSHDAADAAGEELGLSRRQVYALVARWRRGSGLVTDLAVGQSDGGRGCGRLSADVEAVIAEVVQHKYLKRQRPRLSVVHRDVVRACRARGLRAPARNTVARRIAAIDPRAVAQAREGTGAARKLTAVGGLPPEIFRPLEQLQVDHTMIDVIVVDERERLAIGRPYLTVGIDVYSRCLLGMVVTLEAPSAVSVGLCLAHACCVKRPWLERLAVDVDWPMCGKPEQLYVDNASEFRSDALRRGCEQHGIDLSYRPPGRPHFGGIVERVVGTAMAMVHELPGTTFSSSAERGAYESEKRAALTLRELERWLVLAVAVYHGSMHRGLDQPPAAQWDQGVSEFGRPAAVANPTAFLVDFLPVIRRTVTRTGFVIDHIHYYSNALKPWIARRERLGKFVVRRDPRDLSRIWVLDPDGDQYIEVPYRTLSRPAVTLWEHRQAVARMREQGRGAVDEQALFSMIEQMRHLSEGSQKQTRRRRRERERRSHLAVHPKVQVPTPPTETGDVDPATVAPFDDIEEW